MLKCIRCTCIRQHTPHSDIYIWVPYFWTCRTLRYEVWGPSGTLLKEQGSCNLVQNMGHKGPVSRPWCIRPGRSRNQNTILFYSVLFCPVLSCPVLFYSILFRQHTKRRNCVCSLLLASLRWQRILNYTITTTYFCTFKRSQFPKKDY
jgi:hypothetical protein